MEDAEPANDTERLLRESVAAFVAREGDVKRSRDARERYAGFDPNMWKTLAENGWLGLQISERNGGSGLGFAEATAMLEELGKAIVPEPITATALLAGGVLSYGENVTQNAPLLAQIADGTCIAALAWQERANDYTPNHIAAKAVEAASGIHISGTKRFVPAASTASAFIVTALAGESLRAYWVAREAPGITITTDTTVDATSLGTVQFDNVPVGHLVSSVNTAEVINRAVDEARLGASAELLGTMSQALEITLAFVKHREQFGQPIGKFQALQHRLVDLWIQCELSRSSVIRAVQVFDSTTDPRLRGEAVSAAKARCSDAAMLITRQSIQLHGGIGYTHECDIGLYLKRALVLSSWLGNANMQRARFADMAA
jgi:alkylation response protein AidB-like acyl-CoA dehydrogenase